MIKEIFHEFYSITTNSNNPTWNIEVQADTVTLEKIEALIDLLEDELVECNGNEISMIEYAAAFSKDLVSARVADTVNKDLYLVLQFAGSTSILKHLTRNKLFAYCFDWLLNAFDDEISDKKAREYSLANFEALLFSRNETIRKAFEQYFVTWSSCLFYYSKCTGGHNKLAKDCVSDKFLIEIVRKYCLKNPSEDTVFALSSVSAWCNKHGLEQEEDQANLALIEMYENPKSEVEIKGRIAMHFSVASKVYEKLTRNQWADLALTEYRKCLGQHELFQVLISRYSNVNDVEYHFDEIINAIQDYSATRPTNNTLLYNYHHDRIFTLVEKLIFLLTRTGEIQKIVQVYGAYFGIAENDLIQGPLVYILPNSFNGAVFSFERDVKHHDNNVDLKTIMNLENSFLGTTATFNDDLTFEYSAPKRYGVPDRTFAAEYFSKVAERLAIESLKMYHQTRNLNGLFFHFGSNWPIQALISETFGVTVPVIQSFQNPLNQRPINNVLVCSGSTFMSELQTNGIKEIFESNNIQVTIWESRNNTLASFITEYSSAAYDLIWILGHGEYDAYQTEKTFLSLSEEINISVEELRKLSPSYVDRRLLILDTCDSASRGLVGPGAIGIGAVLINKHQSVIGHSWPVENISSLIMGLLLSNELSNGNTYENSHSAALGQFRSGRENVLEVLQPQITNEDILDRISNCSIDFSNPYYWASPVYFI
ncbi:CHAT domain-containing protein [Pinibacter aurantiacus]|uniref:CHAT domain-containing protein n=1 Tax=Pinibacter aurantiacus TaxID=2851599 RepID=A0A9E2W2I2_9BACT|nr:CHAT domain-containing protein [Pinibacter aurantiacus]MBV4357360.1 CHAT domain-containing protein [Pinibacter aurantiacus]